MVQKRVCKANSNHQINIPGFQEPPKWNCRRK